MEWATLVISIVAILAPIVYSVVVDRRAQKSAAAADARAVHAQQTADDMGRSLGDIATSLAEMAKARTPGRQIGQFRRLEEAPKLAPRWNIERAGNGQYVLRNVGSATASNVQVDPAGGSVMVGPNAPRNLDPVEGMTIYDTADYETGPMPRELAVTCDELGNTLVAVPSN